MNVTRLQAENKLQVDRFMEDAPDLSLIRVTIWGRNAAPNIRPFALYINVIVSIKCSFPKFSMPEEEP